MFKPAVAVNIKTAVSSGSISSLNHSIFIDTNMYHKARLTPYYSFTDVQADKGVPSNSKAYSALQEAFKNANSNSLPIYLARREATDSTFTPTVANSTVYSFKVQVFDTTTNTETLAPTLVTFPSDVDATAAEIVAGLDAAITTAAIPVTDLITDVTGDVLKITPAATRQLVFTEVTNNLPQTFGATETAADAFAAIQAEDNESWYYVTTSVRDDDWVLDLCDEIDATESSDYPKVFRTSSNDITTLSVQTDPSNPADLLGRMEDAELNNCTGEWHNQSDTIFPELAACVYQGSFFVGTQSWSFMPNCSVPAARHPVLGRLLTNAEVGFITDRNASVRMKEMGVTIYKGGDKGDIAKGTGAWIDNLNISHWIRLTMKLRVFNALVNAANAGLPLTFTAADRAIIKERCTSVLIEAVQRKMLSKFDEVVVPTTISFEDQASRTLKDVSFTGYFAGKIHFVIINGVLTYSEEV